MQRADAFGARLAVTHQAYCRGRNVTFAPMGGLVQENKQSAMHALVDGTVMGKDFLTKQQHATHAFLDTTPHLARHIVSRAQVESMPGLRLKHASIALEVSMGSAWGKPQS